MEIRWKGAAESRRQTAWMQLSEWVRLSFTVALMMALVAGSAAGDQPTLPLAPPRQPERVDGREAPSEAEIRRVVEEVLKRRAADDGALGSGLGFQDAVGLGDDAIDRFPAMSSSVISPPQMTSAASVPLGDLVSEHLSVKLRGGGKLQIYGFGRGDFVYADSRLSNTVIPFFALSEDPASPTPVPNNDSQLNANVRLTRLGFDYGGTRAKWLGCPELSAKIEIDFETLLNITSESRAVPRIRLAYGKMTWGEFSVLLGESWDAISPLNPMINDDTLMWNAGNLGDRRPMLRADWDHDLGGDRRFILATAISSGGAVDRQDLDGNGIKDGEDSAAPAVQQRIGYRFPTRFTCGTAEVGFSWLVSFESVDTPIGGHSDFVGRGVGLDWVVPLCNSVTWRGESWYGRDLSDWRGGIAQGVNSTTGEEIESRGGWTELQFEPYSCYRVATGLTVDDPLDSDLIGNATVRRHNSTWYVGNRFNFGGGLNIHANFEFWETKYLGLESGDAFRFKTVLMQKF